MLTVVFLRGRQVVEQILGPAVLILDLSLEGPEVWHRSKLGSSQLACLGVKVEVSPSIPFRRTPLPGRCVGPNILPADNLEMSYSRLYKHGRSHVIWHAERQLTDRL